MPSHSRRLLLCAVTALSTGAVSAAALADETPLRIVGPVVRTHYDGQSNDLLTAGLGASGLTAAAPAPGFADPLNPTEEELRRLAIYNNYRALVDVAPGGGYGLFWGPNVAADGTVTTGQGLIPGDEVLAFAVQPDGSRVTLMVQVPDSFDPAHACIVTGPSSGSRGIYGAIATSGEWGLKHGCAVAYTDKGSGTGFEDLYNGLVTTLRGEVVPIATAGDNSQFTVPLSQSARAAYDAAYPYRFAFKHAHSQVNPEKAWGQYVLQSIRFAFQVLNDKFPGRINRRSTIVISSSVSNGGGASVRAAEQDSSDLIDGVVAGEPNVNPVYAPFAIQQGGGSLLWAHSRPLIDYVTLQNVYDGCAINELPAGATLLNLYPSAARCTSLYNAGLLKTTTLAQQAAEAQAIINGYGILPEQNPLEGVMWASYVPQSISMTYANAYGRFSVADNLCGYSFAGTDTSGKLPAGTVAPLALAAEKILFGTSNGIPPTGGVSLINNGANVEIRQSTPDQYLQGALCLRKLVPVPGPATSVQFGDKQIRILAGVAQILATGDLKGKPTLIVTGRSDDILPPNHASRAYVGLNQLREGRRSQLHYIEVTNAQHLDTLLTFGPAYGFQQSYLPLHRYFVEALDLMYAHLRNGSALPPSQVVHTVPRGGSLTVVPAISATNVPPIASNPGASTITFSGDVLHIPD